MKCWKCGKENVDGVSKCIYCGMDQNRQTPKTNIGSAMRQLYDQFGAEALLTNPQRLANGIGDLVPDSGKVRNQMRMAMDAGVGKLYLDQIQNVGRADAQFEERVKRVLTEDAELAEKAACELMASFDEMIGWPKKETGKAKPAERKSAEKPKEPPTPKPPHEDVPKAPIRKKQYLAGIIVVLVLIALIIMLLNKNQQNGGGAVPETIVTAIEEPAPTPVPTPEKKEDKYYPNGKLKVKYVYNSDGNLQQTTYYNRFGNVEREEIATEWDKNGNITKEVYHYPNDSDKYAKVYYNRSYDDDGNCIQCSSTLADGSAGTSWSAQYEAKDRIKEATYYNADGSVDEYRTDYKYDEDNHLLSYTSLDVNRNIKKKYNAVWTNGLRTEYTDADSQGKIILHAVYDNYGDILSSSDTDYNWKYIYHDNSYEVESYYLKDGTKSVFEYYENGHVKHYMRYNTDGTKAWETDYRQKADGTWQHKDYMYNGGTLYKEDDWEDE